MLSIGTTVAAIYSDFDGFMHESYFSPAKLTIAIGILIFFVSIFGCLGALKESVLLINIFAFLLTIILILEVAACIAAYAMRNDLEQRIESDMEATMKHFGQNDYYTYSWDSAQEYLQCCGVREHFDWSEVELNCTLSQDIIATSDPGYGFYFVPRSCCDTSKGKNCQSQCQSHNEPIALLGEPHVFSHGCLSRLTYIVSECAFLLGVGCFSVALIQVLGIIFARILASSIRRIKTEMLVEAENYRRQMYNSRLQQNIVNPDEKPKGPVLTESANSEA